MLSDWPDTLLPLWDWPDTVLPQLLCCIQHGLKLQCVTCTLTLHPALVQEPPRFCCSDAWLYVCVCVCLEFFCMRATEVVLQTRAPLLTLVG